MLASSLRTELRRLRRRPLWTATIVATAALAIASATAIATVVRHFVLRPLPGVGAPEELVNLHRTVEADEFGGFSLAELRALAAEAEALEEVTGFRDQGVSLAVSDAPPLLAVAQVVAGNYFATLGAHPAAGRLLRASDDLPGAAPVAVLDHALWRSRFGGDPDLVGRTVRINGHPFEVVGVGPPGFVGTFLGFRFDLYVPLAQIALADPGHSATRADRDLLELVARRRAEASLTTVRAELDRLAADLSRLAPERWRGARFRIERTSGVEPSLYGAAVLFFIALATLGAIAVLVVAANIVGLLLADHLDRRHELAVRAALGGDRRRLLLPLAVQSTLLFACGGVLGCALSLAAAALLRSFSRGLSVPLDLELRPDAAVLGFGVALAIVLGLTVGAIAARRATCAGTADLLAGARGVAGAGAGRARAVLVTAQVLASVVLVTLALFFALHARAARGLELGLEVERVGVVDFEVGLLGLDADEEHRLVARTLARLDALPGVEASAAASPFPLSFGHPTRAVAPSSDDAAAQRVDTAVVSAGYFELLRLPIVAGRGFAPFDDGGAPAVAVVNEQLAAALAPGGSPLERLVYVDGQPVRVVGVARDARTRRPWRAPRPQLFLPLEQHATPRLALAVRARDRDVAALAAEVHRVLAESAPDLGTPPLQPATAQLETLLLPQRSAAAIAAVLGALAVLLSALALYALVAQQVVAARREIGVRQALGATAREIRRLFLGRGLRWTWVGAAAAMPLVAGATRALGSLLPVAGAVEPLDYLVAPAVLIAVAAAASWLPAQRATRVSPAESLRDD
ncbi:MAG TPA: ABC transporter permease [Thermoanaerobaculia bacterium]